jgi:hypothetical protein
MKDKSATFPLKTIISGGQTGADRAALEVGRSLGYRTGGTVPRGFRTNRGPDPTLAPFNVTEDRSPEYAPRTIKNVLNADGTVWFGDGRTPGGRLTLATARKAGRPLIVNPSPVELRQWIVENRIETLNVAGDREENDPGIYERVSRILADALGPARKCGPAY